MNGSGVQGTPSAPSQYANGWLPAQYISPAPPWSNGELQAVVTESGWSPAKGVSAPGGSAGGCGGKCGGGCGGSKGKSNCPGSANCNGLLDGAGSQFAALYSPPQVAPGQYPNTVLYSVQLQNFNPAAMAARN